jgi:DNA-binding transcriptional LysR family regulator
MELRLLRTFKAVAETGSFTQAGRRVNLSQAAVSMHIKSLEDELGTKLFSRVNKRVSLTHVGELLLKHANTILRVYDEARSEIARFGSAGRMSLRVGTASTMISIHPLPEILSELKKQFPLLDLVVFGGTSEAIVKRIVDNRLDVGLISLPADAPNIETEPLYGDRLVAIVTPNHALAHAREVTVTQLAAESLILGEKGGNTRRLIDVLFEQASLKPRVVMELNRAEAIKKMVEVGLGVSILPWLTVRHEVAHGALKALNVRALKHRWELGLAYLKTESPSPVLRGFIELCRNYMGKKVMRRDSRAKAVRSA